MTFTLEVPDSIAHQLQLDGPEAGHRALQMLALEGYREGELSRGQVSEWLGLSFFETEALLHRHGIFLDIPVTDFQRSSDALEQMLAR